jgi:hypothetical protein
VILVIIGANATISELLRQHQNNLLEKEEIKELKTVILWKVLMLECKTYLMCEITLHVAQIEDTTQIQHYIPWKHGLFQVYNCKYIE